MVFSGLSGLVIEDVTDEGELSRVRARSRRVPVPCPERAVETAHVHGWCGRTVADVPVDGRPVVLEEDDRPGLSPRRLARLLLARPDNLKPDQHELLAKTTGACPEMSALAALVRAFARLLVPATDNADRLQEWISTAEKINLLNVHSFIRGLRLDIDTVRAALTSENHNGGTEGVNTKTKLIKRQINSRAGFHLLRHRILLG
ncbi:Transposase [Actinomadura mexicana]|uniref:Transposase n=1 Tax=Actinomadura mexicana TaxID=134959 RepID=A0A239AK11_9ACTN|nr:Transposase [Actinomadura mexicana]